MSSDEFNWYLYCGQIKIWNDDIIGTCKKKITVTDNEISGTILNDSGIILKD